MNLDQPIEKAAVISPCGKYRYSLTRKWGNGLLATFCLLNPSTADAEVDDATVRKCMAYARRWGMDGIRIVNLFAFRARQPKDMLNASDPFGMENYLVFNGIARENCRMICGWGVTVTKPKIAPIAKTIIGYIRDSFSGNLCCLRITKTGQPEHPLYIPMDQPLIPYTP